MEHVWFLQLLQSRMAVDRFEKIRVTHLVLITDAVPRSTAVAGAARSAWDALSAYAPPFGRGSVMSLRRDVLNRWPVL
jgi:hypothetical protein